MNVVVLNELLSHGWHLTFAQNKQKNPGSLMGAGWQSKCATNETDAEKWLQKCPDANVGVLLGPRSGIVDVEFDTVEGRNILDELLEQDPGSPTPTYRSGKSIHRLYRFDNSLPLRTVLSYRGVEFRIGASGNALQSILPPSTHPTGRKYEWLDGLSPSEVSVTSMPFPLWDFAHYISTLRAEDHAEIDETGDLYVPEGARHDWMVKRAAQLRDWGLSKPQLRQVVDVLDTEVVHYDREDREHKLDSIVDWAVDNIKPKKQGLPEAAYRSESTTAADLLEKKIVREFAVENLMVMNEPMVIGGASKSLKTSILLDLAVSIATGTKVLITFKVPKAQSVMVISGESGEKTLQDTIRSIALERGLSASDLSNLHISYRLPKLDDPQHVDDLIAELKNKGIKIVFIDPLYRSLRVGDAASNVYSMGEKLELIAEKIHRAGITPVLAHHFKKQGKTHDEAPDLEDLSQAGISEFGRQFLLLKRRKIYEHDGKHILWFQWGGSAGHQGQKIVEVYTGTQDLGLAWKTSLHKCEEWESSQKAEREEQKATSRQELEVERRVEILKFIEENPGCSQNEINREVGGGKTLNKRIVDGLESEEILTSTRTGNQAKRYSGFRPDEQNGL